MQVQWEKEREETFFQCMCKGDLVVYIGVNHTFKVIFTPLEYVATMSKRLNFLGSGFLLFNPMSSI